MMLLVSAGYYSLQTISLNYSVGFDIPFGFYLGMIYSEVSALKSK